MVQLGQMKFYHLLNSHLNETCHLLFDIQSMKYVQNQDPEGLLSLLFFWTFSYSYCWASSHGGFLIVWVATNWSVRFPLKINELGFSQRQQLFKSSFIIHSSGILSDRGWHTCAEFSLYPLLYFQHFFSVSDLPLTILLCFLWCLRTLMVERSSQTFGNFSCTSSETASVRTTELSPWKVRNPCG